MDPGVITEAQAGFRKGLLLTIYSIYKHVAPALKYVFRKFVLFFVCLSAAFYTIDHKNVIFK